MSQVPKPQVQVQVQVPDPRVQVQVQVLRSQVQVQVQVLKTNYQVQHKYRYQYVKIKNQTATALNEYRSVSYYITIYMDFTSLQYCRCYCLFRDKLTVG